MPLLDISDELYLYLNSSAALSKLYSPNSALGRSSTRSRLQDFITLDRNSPGDPMGGHHAIPSGIVPRYPKMTPPWTYWIRPPKTYPEIPWIGTDLPQPWRTEWPWECHVRGHAGNLFPQHKYQNGGITGSQESRHVLDGKILNPHVGEISCHIDIIIEIVIDLVGIWCVPHVKEGTLHEPTGATGNINAKIYVKNVVERVKYTEYIHTIFISLVA